MSNHNTKSKFTQSINRQKQIQQTRKDCLEQAIFCEQEKNVLGFPAISWDSFLEINLNEIVDPKTKQKIIGLRETYKDLITQQQLLQGEDQAIDEMNSKHAIIRCDQTYILTEKENIFGLPDFSLESKQSLKLFYEDEYVECIDGKERSKVDVWLKSPKRRKYDGITFNPKATDVKKFYNLWKGFTKTQQQGQCNKYWDHVEKNICNGEQLTYTYVRRWIASIFQNPEKLHTALILCGSQGVGKNSFVEPLGKLLGVHYAQLSSMSELVSNFNAHLKYAILVHANEACWGGHRKDIGVIKAMITDPICLIESKGKDRIQIKNCKHLIFSSNEAWPVHIDGDDRRFLVLKVSEQHKEDHPYFDAIMKELENGGYEALLYDLLYEDLSDFNPRQIPPNKHAFSIKLRSAESSERYLYEALQLGGFSIGTSNNSEHPVWHNPIAKNSIFEDYLPWCQKSGEIFVSKERFCRTLKKVIPSVVDSRPNILNKRTHCYYFQSLEQTRKEFSKSFKENPNEIFEMNDQVIEII